MQIVQHEYFPSILVEWMKKTVMADLGGYGSTDVLLVIYF